MSFSAWPEMSCTRLAKGEAGGYMRISACNQDDVPKHHMNKVMIASVVPWK
jgi:hypothetical protein